MHGRPPLCPDRPGFRPGHLAFTLALAFALGLGHVGGIGALGAEEQPASRVMVDRFAAVVDETPILLSDIERAIAFGLVARRDQEDAQTYRQRVLDGLIDQHVRLRDARRFERESIAPEAVREQLDAVRERFPEPGTFESRLDALGMTEAGLETLLADQLRVLHHVETRLRARVFVSNEAIQQHYDQEVAAHARDSGQPPPPLETIRDAIRALLTERLLDQEITHWTQELRERADITILLQPTERPLPPVTSIRTPD